MAVLLAYNNSVKLSIKELQEITQLPEKELIKQVQSLVESKLLLVENGETTNSNSNDMFSDSDSKAGSALPDVNENSVIVLNMDYSNKRTKFKINAVVQKETPQETETTQSSVDEDRKLYLQATIVRIMKSRKNLNHNVLIQEVSELRRKRDSCSVLFDTLLLLDHKPVQS